MAEIEKGIEKTPLISGNTLDPRSIEDGLVDGSTGRDSGTSYAHMQGMPDNAEARSDHPAVDPDVVAANVAHNHMNQMPGH